MAAADTRTETRGSKVKDQWDEERDVIEKMVEYARSIRKTLEQQLGIKADDDPETDPET